MENEEKILDYEIDGKFIMDTCLASLPENKRRDSFDWIITVTVLN